DGGRRSEAQRSCEQSGRKTLRYAKRLKTVADSKNSLDILLAVTPEFFSQSPHMHIQRPRTNFVAVTPHAHEQHLAGNYFAGVLRHKRKEFIFLAGQNQPMCVERCALSHEVYFNVRILVA